MIQLDNAVKRYNDIILTDLKAAGITCWLAGGALRDYFMGVTIKSDHDIFFPDEENYNKCAAFFKSKDVVIKWESEHGMKVAYNKRTFDLVKHWFKGPQECIDAFDFTVSMFAVDGNKVYYGESSFIDLAKRQLMLNKIPFPASTMSRAFRYYKKGFYMCQGEMKKLVDAIQDMPRAQAPTRNEDDEGVRPSSGEGMFGNFFRGLD